MKKIETFYKGSGTFVDAYEKADLADIRYKLNIAENAWYNEWVDQGKQNLGTCCLGKGIQIWYRGPRKRSAVPLTVVPSPPCQGNVSAYKSSGPAMEYLKECGIEAEYYDGRMD
jgi:hypothetical protein